MNNTESLNFFAHKTSQDAHIQNWIEGGKALVTPIEG